MKALMFFMLLIAGCNTSTSQLQSIQEPVKQIYNPWKIYNKDNWSLHIPSDYIANGYKISSVDNSISISLMSEFTDQSLLMYASIVAEDEKENGVFLLDSRKGSVSTYDAILLVLIPAPSVLKLEFITMIENKAYVLTCVANKVNSKICFDIVHLLKINNE